MIVYDDLSLYIALLYANKKSKFKLKSNGYTRFGWCIYMNFKRKLWWAQHKNEVYKYGIILSLVLIVTISIIYFTYSKFSSSNEATMYETTVEPFIKNDYFIASYIDGEWSNKIPGKNDGYVVDKIVCDNGATGTWNYSKWSIEIENATKKIKCGVYFITGSLIDVKLYQGLIPVTYNSSGDVVVADANTKWYDYSNHEWANAVLVNCADSAIKSKYFNEDMSLKSSAVGKIISKDEILQMYVYIPRYRYKLFNANNGTSEEQAVDIIFEKVGTEKSNGTKNGKWLTHPAFTFGNTELPGFWAAKFEASGSTDNYQIKPNQKSLTSINLATMYNTSRSTAINVLKYGLNAQSIDTHMMKNMEWGAIAFLTNSIYGRYNDASTCIASGCEVWINNINTGYGNGTAVDGQVQWGPSITGCAGSSVSAGVSSSQTACASGYDWKTKGVNASTTGNQYGIYDMSGGAWEYVMGVQKDSSGNVQVGNSGFSTSSLPDSKYYDLYDYQAEDGVGYTRYHLGDATREVLKDTSSQGRKAWWNDYAYNIYSSAPWVNRGGDYHSGTLAGVFDFNSTHAGGWTDHSFRSVLSAG